MRIEKNRPMIALITNHDDDVYCFRKELIEGIKKNGFDVLISCPSGEKLELMKNLDFIHENINIDRRGTNPITDFKLMLKYRKLLKTYRPDVVLTYTSKPNVYASLAAASLKIPYINNVTGLGSVLFMGNIMKKIVLNMFKLAFKKSSCVFFQNEANMRLAEEQGIVKGYHELIPGSGVNVERYPLQNYPKGGNGITGENVVFNYIGRVLHDKGVDDYIAAAKYIKNKYPNTEFNIIGFIEPTELHYREEFIELENKGIIKYRGQQKDVKPFIARSHAIIHPSVYGEGMSNVLLENASSGRFIITTDNPGCMETVKNNETGYIYSGGNVTELIDKIQKFLQLNNEDRKEMGIAGRNYVKNNFSRELVVEAYLNQIKKIRRENKRLN